MPDKVLHEPISRGPRRFGEIGHMGIEMPTKKRHELLLVPVPARMPQALHPPR
jgi:hypothetical protein